MKGITRNLLAAVAIPAALMTFAGCSSKKSTSTPTSEKTSALVTQQGVPGGIAVETTTITANVTDTNASKRAVTLALPDGKKTTVKCGPQIVNFDQIKVGDRLKLTVTEEFAVHMASEAAPADSGSAAVVALAPKGAKPGGVMASTVQVTATVAAIDLKRHKATLKFEDGTEKTFRVRQDVDLTKRKVGEKVVIRTTEAVAISVEKL